MCSCGGRVWVACTITAAAADCWFDQLLRAVLSGCGMVALWPLMRWCATVLCVCRAAGIQQLPFTIKPEAYVAAAVAQRMWRTVLQW